MVRQLTLDLPIEPRYGREDFLVSASNAAALDAVELWPGWPDRVLLLIGPEGSGKTHLGAIWAARAGAVALSAGDVAGAELSRLASQQAILLDNADQIEDCEAELFHLLNLVRENGAFLLLTAQRRPDLWGLCVPDLISRLRLAPAIEIEAPDDALIRAVLVKLFADRQLAVDAGILEYVARRIERSLEAARTTVAALDREALARGRRVTRAIAAAVLREIGETSDESC